VADPADVDGLQDALADAGFPPCPDPRPAGRHASADPGRPARVAVRPIGSPEWRNALLHRDWLRAGSPGGSSLRRPPFASSPDTLSVAESWAASSGWRPPMR
jgi:dephospho-CoA kinase